MGFLAGGLVLGIIYFVLRSTRKPGDKSLSDLAGGATVGPSGSMKLGAGEEARLNGARRHRHGVAK